MPSQTNIGRLSKEYAFYIEGQWQHTLSFGETGQFIVYLEAQDEAGNTRSAGPFGVAVMESVYRQYYLPLVFR